MPHSWQFFHVLIENPQSLLIQLSLGKNGLSLRSWRKSSTYFFLGLPSWLTNPACISRVLLPHSTSSLAWAFQSDVFVVLIRAFSLRLCFVCVCVYKFLFLRWIRIFNSRDNGTFHTLDAAQSALRKMHKMLETFKKVTVANNFKIQRNRFDSKIF